MDPTYSFTPKPLRICVCGLHRTPFARADCRICVCFLGDRDEGPLMGVPVAPSGQDPLAITTTLPPLNQNSGG